MRQLFLVVLCLHTVRASADESLHAVKSIPLDNLPTRIHVIEDFETDIERRWWLRGKVESSSASGGRTGRACRAVETLNFDRKMGDRKNKVRGVVFNPVPGPPMGSKTRLSFRYRIEGSDRIQVQIYSLSKGFHRFVTLTDLVQKEWRQACVDMTKARRPDGSGGPLAEDERIDDLQFYVHPDAELLIDDIVLFDAAPAEELRPFPQRVVFTGWFDTGKQGKEWPGRFDIAPHEPPLTWDYAGSVPDDAGTGHWIKVHLRGRRSIGPRTVVRFRYRLTRASPLRIALVDTQNKRTYVEHLDGIEEGRWAVGRIETLAASNDRERFADEIHFYVDDPSGFGIDDVLIYEPGNPRGSAQALVERPKSFPHRIWAACDFETKTPDYAWFGETTTKDVPSYAGNKTAMGLALSSNPVNAMTGINPVPGPRMGKVNQLYLRYKLKGASTAKFQHFSLSSEDNNHVDIAGLEQGPWAEVTLNFSLDGRRNDGSRGVPFKEGERMDDLKIYVKADKAAERPELFVDDIIFFANDPSRPPEDEPFPKRVLFLAAFDTGTNAKVRDKYWPGTFDLVTEGGPRDSYWGVARAVQRKKTESKWIRLQLSPTRTVGANTKMRFRYHLEGASAMTVQIFDLTDQDNRHIHLTDCEQGRWTTKYVNFTRDGKRNDGGTAPFEIGHVVDDIFFFVKPDKPDQKVELHVDEVVLYDAGE